MTPKWNGVGAAVVPPPNRVKKRQPMPANPSYLENAFELWVRQSGLASGGTEGISSLNLAGSGALISRGRLRKSPLKSTGCAMMARQATRRSRACLNDAEKYEAALLQGWRVYRVPGPWIAEAKGDDVRLIWRTEVMDTLKTLLGAG